MDSVETRGHFNRCKTSNVSYVKTSLCSATYERWQRGTARIRPLHAGAAAVAR